MNADTYYIAAAIMAVGAAVNFGADDREGGFLFAGLAVLNVVLSLSMALLS